MSWSLRKPDVALRVATFVPVVAPAVEPKPIAGLSPTARVWWKDRRAKECAKVAPAIDLDKPEDPERFMCTCHGFERASEYCISFCGKTRD